MNSIDSFIRRTIRAVFGIVHIELKEATADALVQFIKFGVIGLTNTLISYVLNIAVLLALKPYDLSWDYIAGNVVAFILSVLWSFYWNNKYVFTAKGGQKRSLWKALIKTYVAYGFTGIILSNVLSYVWIDLLGISKFVAPLVNLIISVPLNFIINKFWAFKA